jgi:DNA-binding transcriptional regulator YhcF (GntR family)
LVNYVHLGLLPEGARLPTVRELAAELKVNLKTAFRIYRRLAKDNLVEIRPQHGVFVRCSAREAQRSYRSWLQNFLTRVIHEAEQYNLSPLRLSHLLASKAGVSPTRLPSCAVLECNLEQTELFARELRRKLGVETYPILTTARARSRDRLLQKADILVTTDFHAREATAWSAKFHREIFRIQLNPDFHRLLMRHARQGVFPMILTDTSFEARFRRALAATAPPEVVSNLLLVNVRQPAHVRRILSQVRAAYVSPLCIQEVAMQAPSGVQLVTLEDMISPGSIRALRRALLR